jgi:hypothetical protein
MKLDDLYIGWESCWEYRIEESANSELLYLQLSRL